MYFKAFKLIKGYAHTVNGVEKRAADIRDGERGTRLKSTIILHLTLTSFFLMCLKRLGKHCCSAHHLRDSGYLHLLSWPKFPCSVAIPAKNAWPGKATDHQECVPTAMCMCAFGQTTALCTPFPMLPMSFYLAINFSHIAAYAHAILTVVRTWKPLDTSHKAEMAHGHAHKC